MKKLLEYYLIFYLFVRLRYKNSLRKKWKNKSGHYKYFNYSIESLFFFVLMTYFFLFMILFEVIFQIKGIGFLAQKRIPAPFIGIVFAILFFLFRYILFLLFPHLKIRKSEKLRIIRIAIKRTQNINSIYPLIFVIFTSLLFFFLVGLFVYLFGN